jgi:tripartite-type tricarboxylate transporter receptor subunit TctC
MKNRTRGIRAGVILHPSSLIPRSIGALILGFAMMSAAAQEYPSRPIRFLVGVAPGGGTDFVSRVIGQKLTEKWGQPVVTDNRTGATGLIAFATTTCATSRPSR